MTEKEPVTAIEGTEPTKEKEDVICPVCDTFEPQAWRKTMCRNCFHHIDEHGDGNDADKSEKGSDLEKKKTKDSSVKEKTPSKDEPPKTLPKTGIASKSKGLSKLSKSDNKDTALSSPTSKSPVKLQAIKDDSSKGKLSSALTSTSSKKQTTHDKNVSASAKSDTKNDNQPDNKKQTGTGPSALSKWKNQTANLVSDKEKKAADEKAKEIPEEKEKQKGGTVKKFSDDKLNKNKVIEDKHISKDSANKSKAEEISKVRQFGRSISEGGSDDKKFNSLDRLHRGYKDTVDKASTGPSPASPTDKKLAIKQHSTTDSTQKQILGTASGTDKKEASATKTSTALSEKVNKFSSLTQEYNKNGQRKGSFGKNASVEREMPPAGSMSGEGQRLDGELEKLKKKLDEMEKKCNTLEKENINLKKGLEVKEQLEGNLQKQKLDVENAIKGLQSQLNSMVSRCSKLETDNTDLLDKLKVQKETHKESPIDVTSTEQFKEMEADLNQSEIDIENLQKENEGLKTEIQDLKVEMDEMYDSFREQEAEEFRDLQRELEMTAKNCRVLQFKLRKAERRNDQIETDRKEYEDKLRTLQNQFEDADARAHIHTIEEELRMAKEVSVRLHDELDILDDKRQKVDEENSHLTRLLEHSDKKQFRLEMEVDKLRDQLTDLRKQLAERSQPGTPSSEEITDRKCLLGRIGKQSSQEQDVSQLMKDLYDSMERETDLKEQLRFSQEEAKSMRRKLEELEDENDNLSQQLKKMSTAQATKRDDISGQFGDKHEVSEAEVELTVQLELNEKELVLLKKKIQDVENEKEKMSEEVITLKKTLKEKDTLLQILPEPSSPNAYYEDKLREINIEVDDLRWKVIEKDRELDSLYAQVNLYQTNQKKVRKSPSLDSEYSQVVDLRRQLDSLHTENSSLKDKINELEKENTHLHSYPIRIESQVFERSSPDDADVNKQENNEMQETPDQLETSVQTIKAPEDGSGGISLQQNGQSFGISADVVILQVESSVENSISNNASRNTTAMELDNQKKELQEENKLNLNAKSEESAVNNVTYVCNQCGYINNADKVDGIARTEHKESDKGESREELMDALLDMEEELESLTKDLKKKTNEVQSLQEQNNLLTDSKEKLKEEHKRRELDLQQELELSTERNDILSNLLDIVKDRAECAEAELERLVTASATSHDSGQSARVISTCSDVSSGSDEVFVGSPGTSPHIPGSPESLSRRQIIQRDWDNQFKKRISSLERLLAEEKQKLAATEKKLALVSTDLLSSAMSDDAKLHAREKELLQGEVFEGQKLLKIATDQLKGLRERVFALEEENQRLKFDTSNIQNDSEESETEKTPSYKLNEGPASRNTFQMPTSGRQDSKGDDDNVHKRKVQDLEKKLLEVEDDWKSKYSSIEKAKADLDSKYKRLSEESLKLKDSLLGFKEDVQRKNNQLREIECKINGNSEIVKRKDEIINEQEEIIKLREGDLQSLLDQISSRDNDIKELNDKIRARDERLKEKDEILKTVNETLESKHDEIIFLNTEINEMTEKIKVQDEEKKEMDRKLSEGSNVTKADWETENERLKQELDDMANNLGKLHTDNNTLHVELEKARQALSEAMVLWNKDRAELEVAHNVAQEKLRLYEESVDKKESQIVALLRKETHKILQIKEKISTELRVTKVEHEANMRTLKNEKLKLQDELTQKIRQLTAEMSSNDKMSQDLDRLKAQEDIAFQIQHHEKVVRAEYLAMKVRYETRLENLQKEHMKLLTVLDKLQREKMLDQEIIKGVQKGMGNMKESYNQNLARWKDERNLLESHIKEIQEGKELADSLRKQVDKLKQQLADQEYERAEIIDKITQERSLWQIQRAELQSQRNELQEKLSMASINQSRTKDLQSRMEVAWESERVEQRRLLNEAHTLALDLQNSIRSREEEFSRERKALLEQMKKMRKELDEVQIGKQAKLVQIEDGVKELEELKQKLTETREKADKEHEASIKDRADLVRRLAEFRRTHKRDQRRIEDVLSELTRLRELAAIVVEAEEGGGSSNEELASRLESFASKDTHASAAASPEPPTLRRTSGDLSKRINDLILQYMKESLKEIHFAADDIARPRSRDGTEEERKKMRRSLSSSELDLLLRDDTPVLQQLESLQQSARRRTPTRTPTPTQQLQRNISCRGPGDLKDHDNSDLGDMPELQTGSLIDRQHKIRADVHLDEGIKIKFPTPPPSFLLPRSRQASPGKPVVLTSSTTKTTITTEKTVTTSRKLPKSISLNTSLQQTNLLPKTHMTKSFSADSSPVVDTSPIVTIPTHSNSVEKIQNTKHTENMTPKTARQKFFEVPETWSPSKCYSDENIVTEKDAPTHILWNTKNTENKSSDKDDSSRSKSKLSVSFEDVEAKADATLSNESTIEFSDSKTYKVVKPKRRLFRRAASMENTTVSDTLANAGVSAISAGAPSTMSPSELFAAVKRKFRHPLRRSTSFGEDSKYKRTQEEEHETKIQNLSGCDSSDLNAPCPERKDKIVTPPTPPISMMNRRILPDLDEDRKSRERESRPQKDNARGEKKKRPRSKSAERAQTGASALSQEIIINEDSFTPISGLPFNETSV